MMITRAWPHFELFRSLAKNLAPLVPGQD